MLPAESSGLAIAITRGVATTSSTAATTSLPAVLSLSSFPTLAKLLHLVFLPPSGDEAAIREAYREQANADSEAGSMKHLGKELEAAIKADEEQTRSRSTATTNTTTTTMMAGSKSTNTASTMGIETLGLLELTEAIPHSFHELSAEEVEQLKWTGAKPFDLAPWVQYPGCVALFVSKEMDKYVAEALKHVVQGTGMGMTQGQLLKMIREATGVEGW